MAFKHVPGMHDIFKDEAEIALAEIKAFCEVCVNLGYKLMINPILEDERLYSYGNTLGVEIVSKEMYTLTDRAGVSLALRPEGTASVARAFIENKILSPAKFYYVSPAFRYERPQRGRLRQHHQLGVEAFGVENESIDAEVILLGDYFLKKLGLEDVSLKINSLGDASCRPKYIDILKSYLGANSEMLCEFHKDSYLLNPLRVLDCKSASCHAIVRNAPIIKDYLCDSCLAHFQGLQQELKNASIEFVVDDFLVRGFDYYTKTVFEWVSPSLGKTQNAVGGGGRYDNLVEVLGGTPSPAVGAAFGLERLMMLMKKSFSVQGRKGCYLIVLDKDFPKFSLIRSLLAAEIVTYSDYQFTSLKAALRRADKLNFRFGLIVGEKEVARKSVLVRDLNSSEEHLVLLEDLVSYLKGKI